MQIIGWQLFIVKGFDHFLFTSAVSGRLWCFHTSVRDKQEQIWHSIRGGLGIITTQNYLYASTVRTYVVYYDGE